MKRHAALIQHSREHHHALKLARLACFAADSGSPEAIAQAAATILDACPETIEAHFRGEEEGILLQLEAIGQHALVARTRDEHARLRVLCQQMRRPDAATLAEFGNLLRDHVRFEERELFEVAQDLLYPVSA
ncbi:MAG: hemerythrin domain-containing protein [Azonexus sp.]